MNRDTDFVIGIAGADNQDDIWVIPERERTSAAAVTSQLIIPKGAPTISSFVPGKDLNTIFALGTNRARGEFLRIDPKVVNS